jgi:cupredoxin-like protein
MRRLALALLVLIAAPAASTAVRADDLPVFRIEIKNGVISPKETEVPANKDFNLEVANTGTIPAEFESKQLRQEKVLAPGKTVTITIRGVDPGEYQFVDEFHENDDAGQGVIVAK